MMFRQIAIASLLTIGSALTFINSVAAQTTDPYVNSLLRQANQATSSANNYSRNVAIPEAQQYQNYLNQLYRACLSGNSSACQEYKIRSSRQIQWQTQINQQYQNWSNNRRY